MEKKIKEENLSLALEFIVNSFGKEVLLNPNKVKSILSDLIPKLETEIKWIVDAINLGVTKILLDENLQDELSKEEAINKVISIFQKEYISELRMDYVLDNLYYAIGWKEEKVADLKEYKESRNKNNETQYKNSNVEDYKSYEEENIINDDDEDELDSLKFTNENIKLKKEPQNYNVNKPPQNTNKKNKKWLLLILLIPILITGISFAYNSLRKPQNIEVTDYKFNEDYDVKDTTYIFPKDKTIEMAVTLSADNTSKLNMDKLSYVVSDPSLCTYKKESNKCFFTGLDEGNIELQICYEGKELKTILIQFINGKGQQGNELQQEQEKSELDKQKEEELQREQAKQEEEAYYSSSEFIEGYIRPIVESYVTSYPYSRNSNDLSYVNPYVTKSGKLYKELVESIPNTYAKGISIELISYSIDDIYYENGRYIAKTNTEYVITKPEEVKHQREYQEFIVVREGSSYYIDKYQNWSRFDMYNM